ncbi:MAG: nucleic acid-binding protein [Planctomycetota bacterium]|nr:nucleic acid-binding protein [Planctomycetota bacterium]
MPATAGSLRDLHMLHQRAKAIRDRLTTGPKVIAAREQALAQRQAAAEVAKKALHDAKLHQKRREGDMKVSQDKIDDLKVKLNQVRKNDEYKALQNQIAHDRSNLSKIEDDVLEDMSKIELLSAEAQKLEAEAKAYAAEVAAAKLQFESHADEQRAQLAELEAAVVDSESIIDELERERYRRTVKQLGADALAAVENHACSGCFVSITAQCMNDLMNGHGLSFCKTCGRLLYLADDSAH